MNLVEAMQARHSVRMYTDEPVEEAVLDVLRSEIDAINQESGLRLQLGSGLEDAFCGYETHYGRFKEAHNAAVILGGQAATARQDIPLQLKVGYYGERLLLRMVQMGLSTSWVVLDDTAEGWWDFLPDEQAIWLVTFGHASRIIGKHRSKPMEELCRIEGGVPMPEWFRKGMEAAMLAPSSLGKQPFTFVLHEDGTVSTELADELFAAVGAGCARYHFEIGAGVDVQWRAAL